MSTERRMSDKKWEKFPCFKENCNGCPELKSCSRCRRTLKYEISLKLREVIDFTVNIFITYNDLIKEYNVLHKEYNVLHKRYGELEDRMLELEHRLPEQKESDKDQVYLSEKNRNKGGRPKHEFTEEETIRFIEMLEQGCSEREIGEEFGIGKTTVNTKKKLIGFKKPIKKRL